MRRPTRLVKQKGPSQEVSFGNSRDLPRTAIVRIRRIVTEHEILFGTQRERLVARIPFADSVIDIAVKSHMAEGRRNALAANSERIRQV